VTRYCSYEGCPHRPDPTQGDGRCRKHVTSRGRIAARLNRPLQLPPAPKQHKKRKSHWKRPPDAPAIEDLPPL
jgi:hypothetical protein